MTKAQESNEKRRTLMLESSPYRAIPVIAAPMIISMLVDSVYNMTDALFVSSMGEIAVAAVGINDALLAYMRAIAMCFATGAVSVLSRMLGAERYREADETASSTLIASIVILSALSAVCLLFITPIATLLGATESVRPYSVEYGRIILMAAPFIAGEVVTSFLLRSEGNTAMSMIGTCAGCVVNIALDPVFIMPWGLGWGIAGAAVATAIGRVVSFTILIMPFIRKKTMLKLSIRKFSFRWAIYRDVIKMGIPGTLRDALMTGSWVVMNNVAGGFGDYALAAITVAKKTINLVASAIMGFGQGYLPIAGFCWGANKFKRVRETFRACTVIGWGCAIVLGALLTIFSRDLAMLFAHDGETETVRIAVLIIVSQSLTLIPHVWGIVINGLCQASGHPVMSTFVGLSRNFICLIPVIYLMAGLFGVEGLALSQAAANILSLAICIPIVIRILKECRTKEMEEAAVNE